MEIHSNEHLDPLGRKQELEKRLARIGSARRGQDGGGGAIRESGRQQVSEARLSEFVEMLKQMDPSDMHRIEDLRARIEDGSYQATVDELIDPLLRFLEPADESDA